jgi:hypothetical protein
MHPHAIFLLSHLIPGVEEKVGREEVENYFSMAHHIE